MVVAEVVAVCEDAAETNVVVDADKTGVMGGTSSQPSLTSMPVLISPRPTILTSSIGIFTAAEKQKVWHIITYLSTKAVTR